MCNEVIEHLTKDIVKKMFREAHRVLSKEGNIIIYSPSMYNREAVHPLHINLHSPQSLKKELEEAGFKKVKHLNKSLKFRLGILNPLNQAIRALFTVLPLPFLSASANCIATKTNE